MRLYINHHQMASQDVTEIMFLMRDRGYENGLLEGTANGVWLDFKVATSKGFRWREGYVKKLRTRTLR